MTDIVEQKWPRDIVERLTEAQKDLLPNCTYECKVDGALLQHAIAEIMRLRTTLANLQAVAGIATAEGQSFADIKRETKR